jgi:hypothetical protein
MTQIFLILNEQSELIKIQDHLIYLIVGPDSKVEVTDEYYMANSEFAEARKSYRTIYMNQPQPLPDLEAAQKAFMRAQRVFIKAQHEFLVHNKFFEEGIDAE